VSVACSLPRQQRSYQPRFPHQRFQYPCGRRVGGWKSYLRRRFRHMPRGMTVTNTSVLASASTKVINDARRLRARFQQMLMTGPTVRLRGASGYQHRHVIRRQRRLWSPRPHLHPLDDAVKKGANTCYWSIRINDAFDLSNEKRSRHFLYRCSPI